MRRLPNGNQATIDSRKIKDYCLSSTHEDGQLKAHLFSSKLGLNTDNAGLLIEALKTAAATEEATLGKQDQYGQRYAIEFEFIGPFGAAKLRSAWIIGPNEFVPRFVTCYIL